MTITLSLRSLNSFVVYILSETFHHHSVRCRVYALSPVSLAVIVEHGVALVRFYGMSGHTNLLTSRLLTRSNAETAECL